MTNTTSESVSRGWAGGMKPRRQLLSYVPGPDDTEPPFATVDYWEPPDPMAMPAKLCDEILAAAARVDPERSGNGTYFNHCLPDELMDAVRDLGRQVNDLWWRLDLNEWHAGVKRYTVGDRHRYHTDMHAGRACRKLAGVVQLSEAHAYEGGDLVVLGFGVQRLVMPRARGSVIIFPGWAAHQVTEITAGERWSLCWNAWGPPLR